MLRAGLAERRKSDECVCRHCVFRLARLSIAARRIGSLSAVPRRAGVDRPRPMRFSCRVRATYPAARGAISRIAASPRHGKALFAASARIDNRNEVAAALGLERSAGQASDTDLVLRSIERAGDAGLARLVGDFAFAYWDRDARELMLGRDCLGRVPLFFHVGRGFAAFASSYSSLFALPDVPRQIDEVMLGHFLALNLWDRRRTLYRGIERVPSRTVVAVNRQRLRTSPLLDAKSRRGADIPDRGRLHRARPRIAGPGGRDRDGRRGRRVADERRARFVRHRGDGGRLGLGDRLDCYTMSHRPTPKSISANGDMPTIATKWRSWRECIRNCGFITTPRR